MAEEPVSFGISDARRIGSAVGWYERNIIDAREPRKRQQFPGGGGGGGGKIWFNVLEISKYYWEVPGCEYVKAVVTQVSCDASVSVGDVVYVFDPHFCWFNLPIALMMRISGTATLSKRGYFNLNACGITPPDCFWAVDSVCCLEEEYGS